MKRLYVRMIQAERRFFALLGYARSEGGHCPIRGPDASFTLKPAYRTKTLGVNQYIAYLIVEHDYLVAGLRTSIHFAYPLSQGGGCSTIEMCSIIDCREQANAFIDNSHDSPCSSKTKLFHIEFSDLNVSKEDSIKPWCDQLESQLFEAEYFADEDSVLVPADVAAVVHPSGEGGLYECQAITIFVSLLSRFNVEFREVSACAVVSMAAILNEAIHKRVVGPRNGVNQLNANEAGMLLLGLNFSHNFGEQFHKGHSHA
jgi:hypothetical protein